MTSILILLMFGVATISMYFCTNDKFRIPMAILWGSLIISDTMMLISLAK